MQKLTVNVPNNKVAVFMELTQNLGLKIDKTAQKSVLTQEQIDLVEEERKKIKTDPDHFLDWEEARKDFKLD